MLSIFVHFQITSKLKKIFRNLKKFIKYFCKFIETIQFYKNLKNFDYNYKKITKLLTSKL